MQSYFSILNDVLDGTLHQHDVFGAEKPSANNLGAVWFNGVTFCMFLVWERFHAARSTKRDKCGQASRLGWPDCVAEGDAWRAFDARGVPAPQFHVFLSEPATIGAEVSRWTETSQPGYRLLVAGAVSTGPSSARDGKIRGRLEMKRAVNGGSLAGGNRVAAGRCWGGCLASRERLGNKLSILPGIALGPM